jgi:nitrite reductase/ring-hydroxylating ferredoxin subunit/DMSO/TMAO reductase YedYZ heme-binding membrane subunit
MSARHLPVGWNRAKIVYDAVLVLGVVGYLLAYLWLAPGLQDSARAVDGPTLMMKAFGSCAFLLLTFTLGIGPLARLDRRFLPLLYNRRHLGVVTFLVALSHAMAALDWYFAFSPTPSFVALLTAEPAHGLPVVPLGLGALLILFALAATSHDFWLRYLTPPVWKALHLLVYLAYALIVAHVAFGQLQNEGLSPLAIVVAASAAVLLALHLAAGIAAWREEAATAPPHPGAPWLDAGPADAIPEGEARIIRPPGAEAVAIFRHEGRFHAVSNRCAHQGGPLGEGSVVDGCITCPWHGFQYRLADGCAPPPYNEKLPTYQLRRQGGRLLLDPRPNPPGTPVPPA